MMNATDRSCFEKIPEKGKELSFDHLLEELKNGSCEAVGGLRSLAGEKIFDVFLNRIEELRKADSIAEQRLSLSVALWKWSGDIRYQDDMIRMLEHQDKFVRASALSALEPIPTTSKLLKRLETLFLEESAELVIMAAVQQLLRRYGFSVYDRNKARNYRSLYRQLTSEDINEKQSALSILKKCYGCGG
jgi:hypothetical protein